MLQITDIQDMYDDLERIQSTTMVDYIHQRLMKDLKLYIQELSYYNPSQKEVDSFLLKVVNK